MSKPENPPAFPQAMTATPAGDVHWSGQAFPGADGMSLRDYFAGQALCGLSAHLTGTRTRLGETKAQAEARWAYERADAMLAERAKGGEA